MSEDLEERMRSVELWQAGHEGVCAERYGHILSNQTAAATARDALSKKMDDGFREIRDLVKTVAGIIIAALIAALAYFVVRYGVMPAP